MDLHGYQVLTWTLSAVVIAAFLVFALAYTYVRRQRLRGSIKFNAEEFITARAQVGTVRIAWSFFAGALGAWVISSPPAYTGSGYGYGAGAIGLVFYSLSSGLPVIMVAFAGAVIRRKVPHVLSLTDFMGWRFGWVAKTYVVLFCLFNMSIACLAEYTTIGKLFGVYLGNENYAYAITVTVGVVTMLYTTYGGLFVSIITDQVQGVAVTLLFTVCVIFVAVTFRYDLPTPFPDDCAAAGTSTANPQGFCLSGTNKVGYSSIFVMPASLFTATVFSEAMWQRAWASADRKSLVRGSIVGCIGIVVVVFFVGLCGILAAWGGQIQELTVGDAYFATDYNLYFLAALGAIVQPNSVDANSEAALATINTINKWIGVVVIVLAVCMNMSAVDSLQNGLTAAISSHFLKGRPVAWTKVAVVLINVPLIVLGALPKSVVDLKVLDLFLLANMLCCTSAIPVLSGLSARLHNLIGGGSVVFAGLFSIFCTSWYGVDYYYGNFDSIAVSNALSGKYQTKDFSSALNYTWMGNGYSWDFFLIPLCVSLGCLMLSAALNWGLQRWHRKPAVMGFVAPATHPHLYPADPREAAEASAPSSEDEAGKTARVSQEGSQEFIVKSVDSPEAQAPVAKA